MSILIITHDLGVVAEMADAVAVMYASKIVEHAPVEELFAEPLHPYTHRTVQVAAGDGPGPLVPAGDDPRHGPQPAAVSPRLQVPSPLPLFARPLARPMSPQLREIRPGHWARCHFAGELSFQ